MIKPITITPERAVAATLALTRVELLFLLKMMDAESRPQDMRMSDQVIIDGAVVMRDTKYHRRPLEFQFTLHESNICTTP